MSWRQIWVSKVQWDQGTIQVKLGYMSRVLQFMSSPTFSWKYSMLDRVTIRWAMWQIHPSSFCVASYTFVGFHMPHVHISGYYLRYMTMNPGTWDSMYNWHLCPCLLCCWNRWSTIDITHPGVTTQQCRVVYCNYCDHLFWSSPTSKERNMVLDRTAVTYVIHINNILWGGLL